MMDNFVVSEALDKYRQIQRKISNDTGNRNFKSVAASRISVPLVVVLRQYVLNDTVMNVPQ